MPAESHWSLIVSKGPWVIKILVSLGALFLFLRWFERMQVFHPSREIFTDDPVPGRKLEDVFLTTSDGLKIHGWFLPADVSSCRKDQVICLFHGNAGNLSSRGEMLATLLGTGANVFAIDYRGYGRSQGKPSEQGTYRDAEAAFDWLAARGFEPSKIIVHGESLGGGVASHLASVRPVGGLILQSTFTSIPDIGADLFPFLPVRWVGAMRYSTRDRMGKISVPVMVMHSRHDEIIPYAHGERNFQAAREPKLFWELKAGHNTYLSEDEDNFVEGLKRYLERWHPCPPSDATSLTPEPKTRK
ncbi:MAG: alpha/beta hydrolase [Verrucomicrobia bacterium]|nr:alpha/beta hydrolase [Verrucomicrobiota bacterium]